MHGCGLLWAELPEVSRQVGAEVEGASFFCGLFLFYLKKKKKPNKKTNKKKKTKTQAWGSKLMLEHGAGSIGLWEGRTAQLLTSTHIFQ